MPEWVIYLIAAATGTLLAILGPPLARRALSMGGSGSRQMDQQRQEAMLLALNSMYEFQKTQVLEWGPPSERSRDERMARIEDLLKALLSAVRDVSLQEGALTKIDAILATVTVVPDSLKQIYEQLAAIHTDAGGTALSASNIHGILFTSREHQEKALAHLASIEAHMAEFTDTNRRVMREMTGSAGTEEDIILERAVQIRAQYPDLRLEDAIKRARALQSYTAR